MWKWLKLLFSKEVKYTEEVETVELPPPTKSSRKLIEAYSTLEQAFIKIRAKYRKAVPGYTLIVTQTYRSVLDQQRLYAKGRTEPGKKVTWVDGVKKMSKHNYYPSRAIDVAVKQLKTGKVMWATEKYKPLVKIVREVSKEVGVKLVSGGTWKKRDYPHIEC